MRQYMPSGPWQWMAMAACSDLGRRNGLLHSAIGIPAALHVQTPESIYLGQGCSIYRLGIDPATLIRCLPVTLRHLSITVQGSSIWNYACNPRVKAQEIKQALASQTEPDPSAIRGLLNTLSIERDLYRGTVREDDKLAKLISWSWVRLSTMLKATLRA